MPASPIRKLVPYAVQARDRGIKIYSLNIGQPDLETPQVGLDALKHIDRKVLEYSPSDGLPSYRNKLVGYYARFGIDLSPENIIVTTGGSEALQLAFPSCINPGDEIIMTEPTYANYISFAMQAGVKVRPIKTDIRNGYALPSVEDFEALIDERTKAILICNPNNPTGYVYTKEEMMRIRDIVKKYDLFLFSDEVYREFHYTDEPYVRYPDRCRHHEKHAAPQCDDEVRPGPSQSASVGANRGRGVARRAEVVYGGYLRRVYRAA